LIKDLDAEHQKFENELRNLAKKSLPLNDLKNNIVDLIIKCSQCI